MQVAKYWTLAGYETVVRQNIVKHITKDVTKYELLQSKTSDTMVAKRDMFIEDIKKLFDVAAPDLEEKLTKSRILDKDDSCTKYRQKSGYTRKTEDLSFLIDQRGERKMVMSVRDVTFEERIDSNRDRKEREKCGEKTHT